MSSIQVRAKKSDGRVYRHFNTKLLEEDKNKLVVTQKVGSPIYGEETRYAWSNLIYYFWMNQPFNVFETYSESGQPEDIYMNIASPAEFDGEVISYTDYELDLIQKPGKSIELLDEDEFHEAIDYFGYSEQFIDNCYEWVKKGRETIENWRWHGWG